MNCLATVMTVVWMAAIPLTAAGTPPESASGPEMFELRSKLVPIITPDLSRVERVVSEQLVAARGEIEDVISRPDASIDALTRAYGSLGQLYHAYELFDAAESCYVNAAMLAPGDFRWVHLLADVARRQGRFELAADRYAAAWSLQPLNFAALVRMGDVNVELDRTDEARAAYQQALALSPAAPSAMAGMGQLALREKDYADAVMFFEAALKMAPDANRLHYGLAMAYRGLGVQDRARAHLERRGTVGVRPPDPVIDQLELLTEGERVHLIRGRLAFGNGRYAEAVEEFRAAVEADPGSSRSRTNLAAALARTGNLEGAVEEYERARNIDPDSRVAQFNLGSLFVHLGRPAEAVPHLEAVLEETPYDAEAELLLAHALVAAGDGFSSLAHFTNAAKLDPTNEEAVLSGASTLVDLGQCARAKPVLEAGLERIPTSGNIMFALARVLVACSDLDTRDGERAHDLAMTVWSAAPTPRHAQLVAQALAESGRCTEAAKWQREVVEAAIADDVDDAILTSLQADLEDYATAEGECRPFLSH